MPSSVLLVLPLPPGPNQWPSHPMRLHKAKRAYQRAAWMAAIQQTTPHADPPEMVRIQAHRYGWNRLDEDGASASLKWVLDALRQKQRGKLDWRQGIYPTRGYLIDDDPQHCTVSTPEQTISRADARLILLIEEDTQ